MCGRFAFFSPAEAITATFGLPDELFASLEPRYNIAPTQSVWVIRANEQGELAAATLRWGLVPFWAKDPAIGNRMINARLETITEKPSYRQPFSRRRCVILASGFYEWHTDESGKWPWFINRADGEVLALAGLWDSWDKGEEPIESCTIITTQANDFMQQLHHRMPVIIDREQLDHWLLSDAASAERQGWLLNQSAPELQSWKVSRKVNSPANDSADLIQAVQA